MQFDRQSGRARFGRELLCDFAAIACFCGEKNLPYVRRVVLDGRRLQGFYACRWSRRTGHACEESTTPDQLFAIEIRDGSLQRYEIVSAYCWRYYGLRIRGHARFQLIRETLS